MAKITKELFDRLYSDDISKKEYDRIIGLIDERFGEIGEIIIPKREKMWFDYQNCDYESENSNGFFDTKEYKLEIGIGGEYADLPEPWNMGSGISAGYLENAFPTRWLWTDDDKILEEFNKEVQKAKNDKLNEKELAKQKREELKIRKAKFKEIIKSKLTKEELKYVNFK